MRDYSRLLRIKTLTGGRMSFRPPPRQGATFGPDVCPGSWLNQSEATLDELLGQIPACSTKGPRFTGSNSSVRGPASIEHWSSRGAEAKTSRIVGNTRQTKVIGAAYSHTAAAMLPTESVLEADCAVLLDWAAGVTRLRTQPMRLRYRDTAVRHTTPDFGCDLHGAPYLIEVKPLSKARQINPDQLLAITMAAVGAGARYAMLTERAIRRQPRLANIQRMRRYGGFPVTAEDIQCVLRAVPEAPSVIKITELERRLGKRWTRLRSTALALIYWHWLLVDWHVPLGPESILQRRQGLSL
ncbi:hypothetical protein [Sinimarinibacterium flocculans]|uniref:hypothetical protein n=1 Tax=Sinimarinibacterium flocculans TaxID=985250 RepID=UPI003517B72C